MGRYPYFVGVGGGSDVGTPPPLLVKHWRSRTTLDVQAACPVPDTESSTILYWRIWPLAGIAGACIVGHFMDMDMVGVLVFGLALAFGFTVAFGLTSTFGWGFVCLGLHSGGVHGRIQDGRHGYGAHGHGQKPGGFPVNMDLLGVLVGLQGEQRVAYLESHPPSLLLRIYENSSSGIIRVSSFRRPPRRT